MNGPQWTACLTKVHKMTNINEPKYWLWAKINLFHSHTVHRQYAILSRLAGKQNLCQTIKLNFSDQPDFNVSGQMGHSQ